MNNNVINTNGGITSVFVVTEATFSYEFRKAMIYIIDQVILNCIVPAKLKADDLKALMVTLTVLREDFNTLKVTSAVNIRNSIRVLNMFEEYHRGLYIKKPMTVNIDPPFPTITSTANDSCRDTNSNKVCPALINGADSALVRALKDILFEVLLYITPAME